MRLLAANPCRFSLTLNAFFGLTIMQILVTAGATWAKVDDVRILTNVFTGSTGIFLAEALAQKHKVTLLVNPHCFSGKVIAKGCRVVPFSYFNQFKSEVIRELTTGKYDVIIHSAAVSDYFLKKPFKGKIASRAAGLKLELVPTPKIIKIMRILAPKAFIVQFKLEMSAAGLLEKAQNSMLANSSDAVVANAYSDLKTGYKAYLISRTHPVMVLGAKRELAQRISELINIKPGFIYGLRS
jgi:phosphopantothenate---cysteine ligase (CTP)